MVDEEIPDEVVMMLLRVAFFAFIAQLLMLFAIFVLAKSQQQLDEIKEKNECHQQDN